VTVLTLARNANTDGWGNKLVTIFARHRDCFILTNSFSLICQIRDSGSGQILHPRQLYRSPGLAKIAPWWLARRDRFVAPSFAANYATASLAKERFGGRSRDSYRRTAPPTFTPSTAGPLWASPSADSLV